MAESLASPPVLAPAIRDKYQINTGREISAPKGAEFTNVHYVPTASVTIPAHLHAQQPQCRGRMRAWGLLCSPGAGRVNGSFPAASASTTGQHSQNGAVTG